MGSFSSNLPQKTNKNHTYDFFSSFRKNKIALEYFVLGENEQTPLKKWPRKACIRFMEIFRIYMDIFLCIFSPYAACYHQTKPNQMNSTPNCISDNTNEKVWKMKSRSYAVNWHNFVVLWQPTCNLIPCDICSFASFDFSIDASTSD